MTIRSLIFSNFLSIPLIPLSWIYGFAVSRRNRAIDQIEPKKLPCGVISVGNLTVGGTGKTPTVIWISRFLRNCGFRVAVLLRGYGRKNGSEIRIVSDGNSILLPIDQSGDEANLIASELSGVAVIVGRDRHKMGMIAVEKFKSQVVVLDDAFQHRQISRDLDIVTLDATQPFGNGRLLPAGILREPRSALNRANIFILTRTDLATEIHRSRASIEQIIGQKQIFETAHRPKTLCKLGTDQSIGFEILRRRKILAVCGIADPSSFVETLKKFQPNSIDLVSFGDHHNYTEKDLRKIRSKSRSVGADLIITTQKDAVKLRRFADEILMFVLGIELEFLGEHESVFRSLLDFYAKTTLRI